MLVEIKLLCQNSFVSYESFMIYLIPQEYSRMIQVYVKCSNPRG